jgi:hypothetical protein
MPIEQSHPSRPATSWSVWTPSAMYARLAAEEALSALPPPTRRRLGDPKTTLARIVAAVDHRQLSAEKATEPLSRLAARLRVYRER